MTWSKTDQDFSSPDKLPTNRKNDSVICYWLRHMQTCSPDPITNSKTTNTEFHEFTMNQISIDGNKIVNKQSKLVKPVWVG